MSGPGCADLTLVPTSVAERRGHPRRKSFISQGKIRIRVDGGAQQLDGEVRDISELGLGVEVRSAMRVGDSVGITGTLGGALSHKTLDGRLATVIYCTRVREGCYSVGLTFKPEPHAAELDASAPDYYDVLQLSPKADPDTIHRVYRLLAQRFHPDNGDTGDQEQFKLILEAYRVLSDPEKRASYDATRTRTRQLRWKIFDQAGAALGKEGERRKRAGILSLLYAHRLNQPHQPGVSIHELEELLGCPREHLEFALWYLKETGLVGRSDSGRYTVTAKGVDRAETDGEPGLPPDRLLEAPRVSQKASFTVSSLA